MVTRSTNTEPNIMKLNFAPNRQKTLVIICILLVSILAIMYLFVYIPANENYLNSRRFQAIQRIENNIQKKQDNTLKLIEQLANAYATDSVDNGALLAYLKYSFNDISKLKFDRLINEKRLGKKDSAVVEPDPKFETEAALDNGELIFSTSRNEIMSRVTIVLKATASGFFKPLLPELVFDEYIVILNNNIAYESFPSGLRGSRYDSLVYINENLKGANTRSIRFSGIDYQAYIQPFSIADQESGFIMGLLKGTTYQAERSYIPAKIVLVIIFFLIVVLILLPWIKLFSLGMRDRITLKDGGLSFVVAMLLVSIIFLAFAQIGINYQEKSPLDGMKRLADKLEQRNADALGNLKIKLHQYDSLYAGNDMLQNSIQSFKSSASINLQNIYVKNEPKRPLSDSIKAFFEKTMDKNINQIFWLDSSTGKEIVNWTASAYNAPLGKFDARSYYNNQRDKIELYTLEPLISWTTGTFRTVLSTQSKKPGQIVCLSFNLKPVMSTILPKGYSFAFVNARGEVLYHSNVSNNLNENLPLESDKPTEILGALQSHRIAYLSTQYRGIQSEMLIRPANLNGFKCWVVIISNNEFQVARETGAFSFTLLMLLLFFSLVSLQLVAVVWISSRNSLLRVFRMETDWIWPRPSSRMVYQFSGFFNLLILVLLVMLYGYAGFLTFFFMLLVTVCVITIFINLLYSLRYQASGQIRLQNYKRRNILGLAGFLLVINLITLKQLWGVTNEVWLFLFFEAGSLLIGLVIFKIFSKRVYSKLVLEFTAGNMQGSERPSTRKFIHSYAFMSITRLVVSSGLPVFFFYQHAYNYQQSIQSHYRHLQFTSQLMGKDTIPDPQDFDKGNVYTDDYYIKDIGESVRNLEAGDYTEEAGLSSDILRRFRVYDTRLTNELDAIAVNKADDGSYWFSPPLGRYHADSGYATYMLRSNKPAIVLSSEAFNYRFPQLMQKGKISLIYWLALLLLLYLLYRAIIIVICRLFALDVPGDPMLDSLAKELLNFKEGSKLSYVTGLPGSRKMKFVRANTPTEGRIILDLFNFPNDEKWREADIVVLNHFEYVISSAETCEKAILLLEKLLLAEKRPALIILSTIHLSGLMRQIERLFSARGKLDTMVIKDKLRIILGHFNLIVIPITSSEIELLTTLPSTDKNNEDKKPELPEMGNWMHDEFSISPFINRLRNPMFSTLVDGRPHDPVQAGGSDKQTFLKGKIKMVQSWFDDKAAIEGDKIVWRLQNIASQFYDHIWQSLSPEERYLVYDIAEEGLVNQADHYHLSMLIQKGLVRRKEPGGQLELINYSFRNFILTSVDKEEALQLQLQLKGSSTWNELRTPLILVVVGILAILLVSQQQTFSSIFGYLTAIAALIPTINALFGLLKSGSPPAN